MHGVEGRVTALFPGRWRAWLKSLDHHHRQIAQGMFAVGFFVLIGKFAGAAKEMAVAWRYGVSETVDAYLFVFNLAQWPISIWAGVVGAVLIPFAARLRHESLGVLPRFRAELLGATLLLGTTLGALTWLVLPWLIQQPWVGFKPETAELASGMANAMAWMIPFGLVSNLFAAWTMSAGRHFNTLLEGVPALVILAAVLLFSGGSRPLVWGTLLGFALQAVLLYTPLRWRGEAERPVFRFRSEHWAAFFAGFGLMLVGQTLMSVTTLVDQFFAARLGPGALSTLGYSNRILALVLGLGAMTIGRAALPVLSRAHAESGAQVGQLVRGWAGLLFLIGLVVTVVGIVLAPLITEFLFQRGAFTVDDTQRVADVLRYALVQVPFYFVSMVLMQALLSQSFYAVVATISGISLIVKIALSWLLVPAMGLAGLLLATSAVYAISVGLCWIVLILEDRQGKV